MGPGPCCHADQITGYVLWGVLALFAVGVIVGIGSVVAGRVFSTLGANGINIVAIAQGSSELNISCAIAGSEATRAVRALHDTFALAR